MTLTPVTKKFSDLSFEIKRLFGDESGVQLTDTDIARWGTEGQMDIAARLGALKMKASSLSVAGQRTYTFPSERIHQVASIHYDGSLLPHTPFIQAENLIIQKDSFPEKQGTPELWYEWGGEFSLWPVPNEAKPVTIYYSAYPEDLSGDPDQPLGLPDKFFSALVNFIMMKCYEMDEDHQASQLSEGRYKEAVAEKFGEDRKGQDMAFSVIQEVDY